MACCSRIVCGCQLCEYSYDLDRKNLVLVVVYDFIKGPQRAVETPKSRHQN